MHLRICVLLPCKLPLQSLTQCEDANSGHTVLEVCLAPALAAYACGCDITKPTSSACTAQVLIGGKDTESGRKAAACLADVYAHWVPPSRPHCS